MELDSSFEGDLQEELLNDVEQKVREDIGGLHSGNEVTHGGNNEYNRYHS